MRDGAHIEGGKSKAASIEIAMGNEQQQQRQQLIVGMDMRFLHNDLTKKPQREEEEEEEESACPIVICL